MAWTLSLKHRLSASVVMLGLVVQLYRWWLQWRRRCFKDKAAQGPSAAARGQEQVHLMPPQLQHNGFGRKVPPPRPGLDNDSRFQRIEDDPRYADGAVLGKAQRAALGETVDPGGNTVSFNPQSTLVRPSLRVVQGCGTASHIETFKHDDVVVIPGFACSQADSRAYENLSHELEKLEAEGVHDVSQAPAVKDLIEKICNYFCINYQQSSFRLAWYRPNSSNDSPQMPFERVSPEFGAPAGNECAVQVTLGATCELRLRRAGFNEFMAFSSFNGSVHLFARDVISRWELEAALCSKSRCQAGLISLCVIGVSAVAAEEALLAPMPVPNDAISNIRREQSRPTMRIITTAEDAHHLENVKHDDVIILPGFFCKEDDWSIYYRLVEEMRENQARGERQAEWVSWHEGAHLLTKNPQGSTTFQAVLDRICEHFKIDNGDKRASMGPDAIGTRFNWYRDGSDWKPFHHDSAAFNAQRAMNQNCTVGVSFGASRELAFRHAQTGELVYFPQTNGMLFFFGRDVNIRWQHAINALPADAQDGKGRVSIILWGRCGMAIDEPGSPPMLTDSNAAASRGAYGTKGLGKGKGKGKYGGVEACRNFQRGICRFGANCRYSHGAAMAGA